ncbi:MAG: MgtC/SapB family protein [Sandaracinobacter sp.]
METLALLQPLALSLAIGLMIGLQRGWQTRDAPAGHRVAGFRTFGLLGFAGGLAALLPIAFGAILMAATAATLVVGYLRESTAADHSATGTVTGLLTLALGGFAAMGHRIEALAGAAILVLLLAMRSRLHRFLRGISVAEIEAATRFAIVALVILPLMPDRAMGPLDAWNPRQLWLVIVLVLGLSFAGYVLARRVGPARGLIATAAAGALVSSTAVTASYARRLRGSSGADGALIAGIAVASAIMYARVLLLTAILAPFALAPLALVAVPAGLVSGALAWKAVRQTSPIPPDGELKLGNPLEFGSAIGLAVFVAVLAVASRWAQQHFGDAGIAALLLLTGFADVDAAVITLAGLPSGTLAPARAGLLLALPVVANMVLKAGLAFILAGGRNGWRAAWPLLATVLAAVIGIALLARV